MPGLGDRSLLFLHIPKTAGTSFRDLLGRRFTPADTLSLGLEDSQGIRQKIVATDRYRFIHGHLPYEVVNFFLRRPFLFTLLRDPVDRAISAFQYMKQQSSTMKQRALRGHISAERAHDYAKAQALTLSEFVHYEPRAAARHLGNLHVEFLTCPDLEKRHQYKPDYEIVVSAKDLDLARTRLTTFDAIGLAERLEDSAEYLACVLQTRPFGELPWTNKTRSRPKLEEVDSATLTALREMTSYDRQLYAFASELFESRWRKITPELSAWRAKHVASILGQHQADCSSLFIAGQPVPGEGWYAPECDGTRWFNWTGPPSESWIELGTPPGETIVLQIGVLHALRQESLSELRIFLNGTELQFKVCRDTIGHTISASVPTHLLRELKESNRVLLRVPNPTRPCDLDPMNDDSRTLGLAIHRMELQTFFKKRKTTSGWTM